MKRLGQAAFDRAHQFLKTQARPLDRAMFEHLFEGEAAESVIAELARFQNEDGGILIALHHSRWLPRRGPSWPIYSATSYKHTWITRSTTRLLRAPGIRFGPGVIFTQTCGEKPSASGAVT